MLGSHILRPTDQPLTPQSINQCLGKDREWARADVRDLLLAAGSHDDPTTASREQRIGCLLRQRLAGERLVAVDQDRRDLTSMTGVDHHDELFGRDWTELVE